MLYPHRILSTLGLFSVLAVCSILLVRSPAESARTMSIRAPMVEEYLHSGELTKGQQALEEALANNPKEDPIRFGLGVLHFVRAVERLGQSLHEYGVYSTNTHVQILRFPVPKNSDPAPISYFAFRRLLDDFHRDLARAEVTLAGITDDRVELPLRLASIHFDLRGDGRPTDKFLDLLKNIMQRTSFEFLKTNPDFLVQFDRGDVAWLRAYCHLLMGMLDFYLAFDTEEIFYCRVDDWFAKPKHRLLDGKIFKQKSSEVWDILHVKEPIRLNRFRLHMLQVVALNRETWRYIRSERDDVHEWLPNPKQKGVLGLPVRDEMIDSWLAMMGEAEALLEGKRTLPKWFGLTKENKGLNFKTLLEDPPSKFVLDGEFPRNLSDKYFSVDKEVNLDALLRFFQLFNDTTAVAYAAWFN